MIALRGQVQQGTCDVCLHIFRVNALHRNVCFQTGLSCSDGTFPFLLKGYCHSFSRRPRWESLSSGSPARFPLGERNSLSSEFPQCSCPLSLSMYTTATSNVSLATFWNSEQTEVRDSLSSRILPGAWNKIAHTQHMCVQRELHFKQGLVFYGAVLYFLRFYFILFFWPCCRACGILVPQPKTEPVQPLSGVLTTGLGSSFFEILSHLLSHYNHSFPLQTCPDPLLWPGSGKISEEDNDI